MQVFVGDDTDFCTAGKSENPIILVYLFQCTFFKLSANVKMIFIGSSCSL